MKKIAAFIMSVALAVSMIPMGISASAAAIPANTVYVDQSLTAAAGATVEFTQSGVKYTAVMGTTAFATAAEAFEAVPAGGTVILAPGTYKDSVTVKKNVTILGPKAGINPNVKGSTATAAWTRDSRRGTDEAILTTSWHMGVNAGSNAVYECTEITVDGLMVSGAGMFRSNYGAAGKIRLTYKNMLVKGYTTNNNGPFYCYSYYPDKSTNNYVREVVAENIRFEGQTTAPGFNLTADTFTATGIYFDEDSTKGLFAYATAAASSASATGVKYTVSDCMFMPQTQAVVLDFTKSAGGHGFNSSIADKGAVEASVKNCVFRYDAATAGTDYSNVIVQKSDTSNVKITLENNTFFTEQVQESGVVDDTHYDLDKEVRFFGRTYTAGNVHYFNWSASGFTFSFEGTGARAVIKSNAPGGNDTAYIKIYVDGVEQKDVMLSSASQTVTLASGLAAGKHTVKVIKRTNARSSTAGVTAIELDAGGKKLAPEAAKEKYIEFIGDSLTVGYASIAGSATSWSTGTEDVANTYAPAIADALGADYGAIAVSGRGIGHNYGGDTDKLIPALYEKTDEYNLPGVAWDYSFTPDAIVLNMGTNDAGCLGTSYTKDDFEKLYLEFVRTLRKHYPDTSIVCVYCLTDVALFKNIRNVVETLQAEGDTNIAFVKLKTVSGSDAALGHPTASGYAKNADAIITAIQELWTKNAPAETEPVTEPETEPVTEPATEAETTAAAAVTEAADTQAPTEKKGCASSAAASAVAAVAALAVLVKKKKED